MIYNNEKTSLLIDSQLPEFIQAEPDYQNFRLFLQAYYEWMEQEGKAIQRTKNLLSYHDIDTTTNEFLDYFTNQFLPYFPKQSLISEQEAVKIAKQLYQTKGTPASYRFLFKILYNSDFDLFYTKDAVLKASAGSWYVAKSLKLATEDLRFLKIQNYRLFGENSKSIATVENAIVAGTKIEVFISNIERLFESGEIVRVIDSNNQDVLIDGEILRAKVVGQVSQVSIDPKNRGLLYQPGDPVIVYDGLNPDIEFPVSATAEVAQTTTGAIKSVTVLTGGYGYRQYPYTTIEFTKAPGAQAVVGSLDPQGISNVAFIPMDSIGIKKNVKLNANNYFFSNIATSNANTTLAKAFSFDSFTTYPLSSVLVTNGGGGIKEIPTVEAKSNYFAETDYALLSSLGILAPIQIINGGHGYHANDVIVFSGGSGRGAYANVATVNAIGAITKIEYVQGPAKLYPIGGMGYKSIDLPSVTVSSSNVQANGASVFVPGILGEGATFSLLVDRVGSVTTINLINPGEDYVATPKVSLKVQDILVSNVAINNLPQKNDVVYQGASVNTSSYYATVNSITELVNNQDPTQSIWNLRVFNYYSTPNTQLSLTIEKTSNIHMVMANTALNSNYNSSGIRYYGDGAAKANAKFLNGLVISQGEYLNSQGQPSSFDVLQSSDYNNFTYEITVQESISKYRGILLDLLHPTGMKVIGRHAMKSNSHLDFHVQNALYQGYPLYYYAGYGSYVTMTTDFTNKSNNIIKFFNIDGANLASFIYPGETEIILKPTNGPNVEARAVSVDYANNKVTLDTNTWLTFANVAVATGNSGSNTINITSLTGKYDIINNGNYSNTSYPLKDIVHIGDSVLIGNNTSKIVSSVDYANGIIYLTANLTSNANSMISVKRNFIANSDYVYNQIEIYGPVGQTYINPQLTTEDGTIITTEDDIILLVG